LNREEKYRERIGYYRSVLKKSVRLSEALEKSLADPAEGSADTCDGARSDEIFLHVYAPVLTVYAEWVLRSAKADGIQRLYFMARDGYFMYLAAGELEKKIKTGIDLRYLKVSRYALRMAEYSLPETDIVSMICVGGIGITFEKLMRRGALTDEEIREVAEAVGINGIKGALQYREILELREKLREVPLFEKYVRAHAGACFDVTAAYLRQEGLADPAEYGIVDSGWIGTVQRSLQRLLAAGSGVKRELTGYYFGLFEVQNGCEEKYFRSFYLSPFRDIRRKMRFSICLFEAVCSAPAGMTIGYCREGDCILPVESGRNPNAERIRRNAELLRRFASEYTPKRWGYRGLTREYPAKQYALLVEKLLSVHMGTPTEAEAKLYGNYLFCDDVLESEMQEVAAVWDAAEIRNERCLQKILIRRGIRKEELHESGWPEASIVNASTDPAAFLRSERIYKYLIYMRKALAKHQ